MTGSSDDGFVKALARRVLGPAVARQRLRQIAAWTKEHDSWGECVAFCNSVNPGGYDSDLLTRYRADKFRGAYLERELRDMASPECARLLLEAVTLVAAREGRTPYVVDLGGAFGEGALYLRALLRAEVGYAVVETDAVVAMARAANYTHAAFVTTALELPGRGDGPSLLFSHGALQYAPDPLARLHDLLRHRYSLVVLGLNAFNPNGRSVSHVSSLSWNGVGSHPRGYRDVLVAYPRWNIDERAVVALLDEAGYVLEREANYTYFSEVDAYSKDLFFRPKAATAVR